MSVEICEPPTGVINAEDIDQEFEFLTPEERIERAADLFAGRLVLASSLDGTAPILLDKIKAVAPDTKVINIRHHHETLKTTKIITWYERESDFDVRIYDAPVLPIPPENSSDFAEFQRRIKVETFQKMLDDLKPAAYLSGAMGWQSCERTEWPIVEEKGSVLAIRPIIDLSESEAMDLLAQTDLPYDQNSSDPTKGVNQDLACGLNEAKFNDRGE